MKPMVKLGMVCLALFLNTGVPSAQDGESAGQSTRAERHQKHGFHRNHFGGLLGVSTHHDSKDSGITLGLDYIRQLSRHWGVGGFIELVDSELERDQILALSVTYYPIRRVGLMLAPGVEFGQREVEGGEAEDELEFVLRFGGGYGFRLTDAAALGPALFLDYAGDRWTSVIALDMVVGF